MSGSSQYFSILYLNDRFSIYAYFSAPLTGFYYLFHFKVPLLRSFSHTSPWRTGRYLHILLRRMKIFWRILDRIRVQKIFLP